MYFWLLWWFIDVHFLFQADSLDEAIDIVNRNKYFLDLLPFVFLVSLSFSPLSFLPLSAILFFIHHNHRRYGNGVSIFTTSGAAARKFQIEIEAGQVKSMEEI